MHSFSRRATVLSGLAFAMQPLAIAESASQAKEKVDPIEGKKDLVRKANAHWDAEHKRLLAEAKAAEKRGEFASLSPPQALTPFKDWDYYYTRGISVWRPNPGQTFKPVSVPDGFVTDLASISQVLWSFGLRPEGSYAYAAVIHDYLYWMQDRSREEADEIFLIAMADSKVKESLRNRLYNAVSLGGAPAWRKNAELKKKGEKRLLQQFPPDFTITWADWKTRPGVFRD